MKVPFFLLTALLVSHICRGQSQYAGLKNYTPRKVDTAFIHQKSSVLVPRITTEMIKEIQSGKIDVKTPVLPAFEKKILESKAKVFSGSDSVKREEIYRKLLFGPQPAIKRIRAYQWAIPETI